MIFLHVSVVSDDCWAIGWGEKRCRVKLSITMELNDGEKTTTKVLILKVLKENYACAFWKDSLNAVEYIWKKSSHMFTSRCGMNSVFMFRPVNEDFVCYSALIVIRQT